MWSWNWFWQRKTKAFKPFTHEFFKWKQEMVVGGGGSRHLAHLISEKQVNPHFYLPTIGYYLYLTVDVSHRPRQVKIHYIMTQNHTISLLHWITWLNIIPEIKTWPWCNTCEESFNERTDECFSNESHGELNEGDLLLVLPLCLDKVLSWLQFQNCREAAGVSFIHLFNN